MIYFDAALPGARHRQPIIERARLRQVPVEAVWIKTPLDLALARNATRPADRRVPEAAIRTVAAGFEPPSRDEGFDRVVIVEDGAAAI